MPIPTTLGTDYSGAQSAVRIGVNEAPQALATATASSSTVGAVTLNAGQGVITSPGLTTSLSYSLVVTNSVVSSTDIVWLSCQNGTNTASVQLSPGLVTVGNGTFSCVFNNINTAAHNGTIQFAFQIEKMIPLFQQD